MADVRNIDGSTFEIVRLRGGAVKQARLMLGWSQGELAHRVMLIAKTTFTAASVSYFETGHTKVLRPSNEKALRDTFAAHGVDIEGGAIRVQRPRLAVAE